MESCWSDFPPRELLLGFGVVEYFGGYLMNRRSSSFLIHRSSLVIAVIAQAFVTRGLKQVYSSNLLVTCSTRKKSTVRVLLLLHWSTYLLLQSALLNRLCACGYCAQGRTIPAHSNKLSPTVPSSKPGSWNLHGQICACDLEVLTQLTSFAYFTAREQTNVFTSYIKPRMWTINKINGSTEHSRGWI